MAYVYRHLRLANLSRSNKLKGRKFSAETLAKMKISRIV